MAQVKVLYEPNTSLLTVAQCGYYRRSIEVTTIATSVITLAEIIHGLNAS
jgi:hypothetical protein